LKRKWALDGKQKQIKERRKMFSNYKKKSMLIIETRHEIKIHLKQPTLIFIFA
jgi:hypothetical protein